VAGRVTTADRRERGTIWTIVFVVSLSAAGAILLLVSIPKLWAVLATLGVAIATARTVRDIRGNRAM